ncbi:MAG: (4Fe-4S)-binding protein [Acidobacteriota bacterium]|nr:(4Fe-4S)-binding protein [Acidobacteriota bacterium]
MKDPVQRYAKGPLSVTFDPRVCTHSAVCVRGLYDVFDVSKKPWVNLDGASAERVVEQVKRCPSGALQFTVEASKG